MTTEAILPTPAGQIGEGGQAAPDEALHNLRAILLRDTQTQIAELTAESAESQAALEALQHRLAQLQAQLADLQNQMAADSAQLYPRLEQRLPRLTQAAARNTPDQMAQALAPLIGPATRLSIQQAPADLTKALSPIILDMVVRVIRDAMRDLQRQIDARLQSAVARQRLLRTLVARLQGVSPAELTLRDALPFEIRELFLIQHGSGLLMAHCSQGQASVDSDLISGMLTAIRDFVNDSFVADRPGDELDEIQRGDQCIILRSGVHVYLAAVIAGTEPEGFRARLRQFVAQLETDHGPLLAAYTGDPAGLPDLTPVMEALLSGWATAMNGNPPQPSLSPSSRRILGGLGCLSLLLLALTIFYLWLTIRLLPVALAANRPTATFSPTLTLTPTPTAQSTATPTATPTATLTATPFPTVTPPPTQRPSPTSTPAPTEMPRPTSTATPAFFFSLNPVFVRFLPDNNAQIVGAVEPDTPLRILARQAGWLQIEWEAGFLGVKRGWAPEQYIESSGWISADTPTPTGGP